jgi:hypothetical protein
LEYLMPVVEMFKKNSDDVTAIPRYMEGQNATTGAAGTASGMSMLMANASVVMKELLCAYDSVTRTFIESLYYWNMQFNPDESIKGDFSIKARGAASLMAKELRAQQLDAFAATLTPEDAQYIKREELLRQRAEAHDLTSIIKTEEEVQAEQNSSQAQAAAQLQQQMQAIQLQTAQLSVEKLQAQITQITAQVGVLQATATKTNVDAAYAGMQAGGVAAQSSAIASAGDAVLLSAGYIDHTPQGQAPTGPEPTGVAIAPNGAQVPAAGQPPQGPIPTNGGQAPTDPLSTNPPAQPQPGPPTAAIHPPSAAAGAGVGEAHGIETARMDGAPQQ